MGLIGCIFLTISRFNYSTDYQNRSSSSGEYSLLTLVLYNICIDYLSILKHEQYHHQVEKEPEEADEEEHEGGDHVAPARHQQRETFLVGAHYCGVHVFRV